MKIENGVKLREEIRKRLSQGKDKLKWLEEQVRDEKNHEKLKIKLEDAKAKMAEMKETFGRFEKKALEYTEKNPKKALAVAAAAGILAASLWSAFQGKKTASPPKKAAKSKKAKIVSKR